MVAVLQTSHFTPEQAGEIFDLVKPKLSIIHHATVNDASRAALISDVSPLSDATLQPSATAVCIAHATCWGLVMICVDQIGWHC